MKELLQTIYLVAKSCKIISKTFETCAWSFTNMTILSLKMQSFQASFRATFSEKVKLQ